MERNAPRLEEEVPQGRGLKPLGILGAVTVPVLFVFLLARLFGAPTIEGCEGPIRNLIGETNGCDGEVLFESFTIASFQKFNPKTNDYVVSADYRGMCASNGETKVFQGAAKDAKGSRAVTAVVRRSLLGCEALMPTWENVIGPDSAEIERAFEELGRAVEQQMGGLR